MNKIILLIVVAATLWPLTHPGLFEVHDPTSIIRFFTLRQSIFDGQFPSAWTNLLNFDFGYPLFLYYAPLFSYLGVFLKTFVPTYLISLKLAIAALTLFGSLGMYKLMQKYGKNIALLASLSFTLLPYHASTLYVRGSYAELSTMSLLPWLLYSWSCNIKSKQSYILPTLFTALFLISHNSLPFLFLPFLIWWIFLQQRHNLKNVAIISVLSLGLTAWFLFPVLFERGLVQLESIARTTILSDHFVTISQLWHSPWGYGGSASPSSADGMSFMLGKFQLILALVALIALTFKRQWDKSLLYFFALTIVYALSTTPLTKVFWDMFPVLEIVQFPWRLLAYASFGLSILSAFSLLLIPPRYRTGAMFVLIVALLYFNLKFFVPENYLDLNDKNYLNQENLNTTAAKKIPEYLPLAMPIFPTQKISDGLSRTPTKVTGRLIRQVEAPLVIYTAYMPQWQLKLDNRIIAIQPTPEGYIQTKGNVPAGTSNLTLVWQRTFIEKLGLVISAFSAIIVIGLWLL